VDLLIAWIDFLSLLIVFLMWNYSLFDTINRVRVKGNYRKRDKAPKKQQLIVLYFKTFSYLCSPIQAAVQIGCKISGLS